MQLVGTFSATPLYSTILKKDPLNILDLLIFLFTDTRAQLCTSSIPIYIYICGMYPVSFRKQGNIGDIICIIRLMDNRHLSPIHCSLPQYQVGGV